MAIAPASYEGARLRMVSEQLAARGITDEAVLAAMATVPRHCFVPVEQVVCAYEDRPLAIGHGQTISQPYIVALMTEVLGVCRGARVLEVGTGSGYQAAVLAALGAEVFTIERVPELGEAAAARLRELGYGERVHVRIGDGSVGWPEMAPFTVIVVTAAAPRVPRALVRQLHPDGSLVLPLGESELQGLVRIRRGSAGTWEEDYFGECRFVKLVGADGWEEV